MNKKLLATVLCRSVYSTVGLKDNSSVCGYECRLRIHPSSPCIKIEFIVVRSQKVQ
jgi:hypothetical protein